MRLFYIVFLFLFFPLSTNAEHFLVGFEDIPLMTGATQTENETFSFGNEEVRYVETYVVFPQNKTFFDVKKFYIETLKQLGWFEHTNNATSISFYRENDLLEILKLAETPLKISIILKNRN